MGRPAKTAERSWNQRGETVNWQKSGLDGLFNQQLWKWEGKLPGIRNEFWIWREAYMQAYGNIPEVGVCRWALRWRLWGPGKADSKWPGEAETRLEAWRDQTRRMGDFGKTVEQTDILAGVAYLQAIDLASARVGNGGVDTTAFCQLTDKYERMRRLSAAMRGAALPDTTFKVAKNLKASAKGTVEAALEGLDGEAKKRKLEEMAGGKI